jgi:hypothetical protein
MTLVVITLFLGLSISSVNADENLNRVKKHETVTLGYITSKPDGSITKEKVELSKDELNDLKETLSVFIEAIQTKIEYDEITEIFNRLTKDKSLPLIDTIKNIIQNIIENIVNKTSHWRRLVISHGNCFKLNLFQNSDFSFYKRFAFWRYSPKKEIFPSKTLIYYPPLNIKVLQGWQLGLMTKFIGIHIYIADKLPEQSYTFFFGTARYISGIQLKRI